MEKCKNEQKEKQNNKQKIIERIEKNKEIQEQKQKIVEREER